MQTQDLNKQQQDGFIESRSQVDRKLIINMGQTRSNTQQQRWEPGSKPERVPDRLLRSISQPQSQTQTTTQQLLNSFCQTCEHPDVTFDFKRTG